MKKILLALLAINATVLYAQQSKWQLGVNFSPDYTNIWNHKKEKDSWGQAYKDAFRSSYRFSTGILVNRNIGSRWIIETGLTYIQQKEILNNFYYQVYSSRVRETPALSLNSVNHFLAIPVNALCFINKGKTRFFVQMGAAPIFFLSSNGYTERKYSSGELVGGYFRTGSKDRIVYNRIEYIQGVFGAGLSRQISNRFEVRMTPTYRHYFSTLYKPLEGFNPYSIGLNISAFIKL